MREKEKRARWMLGGGFLALLVLSVTACDFDVVNPGQITEDALDNPDAIGIILNGAIGDVEAAFDNLALHTALASGELKFSGTRSWLGFMGDGDMRPEDANESWQPAATARWTTVEAVRRLTELGASSDEIWLFRQPADGYWRNWLYDSGVGSAFDGSWIDLDTGSPTTAKLERGRGWWYRSYPDARDPGFTWNAPVPY